MSLWPSERRVNVLLRAGLRAFDGTSVQGRRNRAGWSRAEHSVAPRSLARVDLLKLGLHATGLRTK